MKNIEDGIRGEIHEHKGPLFASYRDALTHLRKNTTRAKKRRRNKIIGGIIISGIIYYLGVEVGVFPSPPEICSNLLEQILNNEQEFKPQLDNNSSALFQGLNIQLTHILYSSNNLVTKVLEQNQYN